MNAFPEHTHRPTSFFIEDILLNKPKPMLHGGRAELTAATLAGALPRAPLPEFGGYAYMHNPAAAAAAAYLQGHQHFAHTAFLPKPSDHPFLFPTAAGKLLLYQLLLVKYGKSTSLYFATKLVLKSE